MKNRNEKWQPKWVALPILDFLRKVRSFKDEPDKGWEWITEFTNALVVGDECSSCELANKLVHEAKEFFSKKEKAGRIGGQASVNARRFMNKIPPPRSFEEVVAFVDKQGLDYDDARLWWQRNFVERPGCDKDGVVFDNWKGALINACKAEAKKRNTEK